MARCLLKSTALLGFTACVASQVQDATVLVQRSSLAEPVMGLNGDDAGQPKTPLRSLLNQTKAVLEVRLMEQKNQTFNFIQEQARKRWRAESVRKNRTAERELRWKAERKEKKERWAVEKKEVMEKAMRDVEAAEQARKAALSGKANVTEPSPAVEEAVQAPADELEATALAAKKPAATNATKAANPKAAAIPAQKSPKAAVPKADRPKAAVPKADRPKAAVPKEDRPKAAVPKADRPKAAVPKAAVPKAAVPKAAVPKAAVPKAAVPKAMPAAAKPAQK